MNRQVSHSRYAIDKTSAIIAQNTLLVCRMGSHITIMVTLKVILIEQFNHPPF
jgi:hypothetical protein